MLSQSISSMESFASLAVVFTLHRLVSLSSVPELLPAVVAGNNASSGAAGDKSGFLIYARDTTHVVGALDLSGEGAPGDIAGAASCDAADVFSAALGGYGPLYGEVLDERAALYIPEKSGVGAAGSYIQPGDSVSRAVENSAENRYRSELAGKLDVRAECDI